MSPEAEDPPTWAEIIAPDVITPTRSAEISVNGNPFATNAEPCKHHAENIRVEALVAQLMDPENTGEIESWQARLRCRCGECGIVMDIDPASARVPRTSEHGVVVNLYPREEG